MSRFVTSAFLLMAVLCFCAGDWPQWRGPSGLGIATDVSPPLKWDPQTNVRWRVSLDGPGNSSPIVIGDKVFLSHAPTMSKLRTLRCYSRTSGELVWSREVEFDGKETSHQTNPYCSSSPVSDGERIVVWFGSAGLHCYDLAGNLLWKQDLGSFDHLWGTGSSPVIVANKVLLNAGPGMPAFVVALDKKSGEILWRKEYPEMASTKPDEYRGSWSTPVIYQEQERQAALLSLPMSLRSIDVETGDELWSCSGLSKLVYTSPLFGDDIVVAMSGYKGPALAVRTGGKGDVTDTHRLWRQDQGIPQRVGSGVLIEKHIYILNEPGIFWCQNAQTGEKLWEERIGKGVSWSSLVVANGLIYATNIGGNTLVLKANPQGSEILSENALGELTRSSPAFSNDEIFLRTYSALYCIGE